MITKLFRSSLEKEREREKNDFLISGGVTEETRSGKSHLIYCSNLHTHTHEKSVHDVLPSLIIRTSASLLRHFFFIGSS